jgi:hypothetical protein
MEAVIQTTTSNGAALSVKTALRSFIFRVMQAVLYSGV